jgi:hypothetical protein
MIPAVILTVGVLVTILLFVREYRDAKRERRLEALRGNPPMRSRR